MVFLGEFCPDLLEADSGHIKPESSSPSCLITNKRPPKSRFALHSMLPPNYNLSVPQVESAAMSGPGAFMRRTREGMRLYQSYHVTILVEARYRHAASPPFPTRPPHAHKARKHQFFWKVFNSHLFLFHFGDHLTSLSLHCGNVTCTQS